MRNRNVEMLSLDQIVVSRGRELDLDAVASMVDSIKANGLLTPISVFATDEGEYRIISGRHRLAAMRSLGRDKIDALVHYNLSEIEVRIAEIVENLHRAELTALQRSEQIAEYARLVRERRQEGGAQVGQHLSNVKGASGREAGDSAAAQDLGVTRQAVQRAEKIAKLSAEAKAAAKETGVDDNQSALLKAAEAPTERQQVAIIEIASEKAAKKGSKRRSGKDVKSVDETVKAILRDFSVSNVKLIIAALNLATTPTVNEPCLISDVGNTVLERHEAGRQPANILLSTDDDAAEVAMSSNHVQAPGSDQSWADADWESAIEDDPPPVWREGEKEEFTARFEDLDLELAQLDALERSTGVPSPN